MKKYVTLRIPLAESGISELPAGQCTSVYKAIAADNYTYFILLKSSKILAVTFLKSCFHKDSSALLHADPEYKIKICPNVEKPAIFI